MRSGTLTSSFLFLLKYISISNTPYCAKKTSAGRVSLVCFAVMEKQNLHMIHSRWCLEIGCYLQYIKLIFCTQYILTMWCFSFTLRGYNSAVFSLLATCKEKQKHYMNRFILLKWKWGKLMPRFPFCASIWHFICKLRMSELYVYLFKHGVALMFEGDTMRNTTYTTLCRFQTRLVCGILACTAIIFAACSVALGKAVLLGWATTLIQYWIISSGVGGAPGGWIKNWLLWSPVAAGEKGKKRKKGV